MGDARIILFYTNNCMKLVYIWSKDTFTYILFVMLTYYIEYENDFIIVQCIAFQIDVYII